MRRPASWSPSATKPARGWSRTSSRRPLVRKAADGGFVPAQAKLGEIYFHGRGAPASVSQAATVAYGGGAGVKAAGALSSLFPGGLSVPQDYREAAKWNLAAADADDTGAQVRWGYQTAAGLGVAQDYAEARHWLKPPPTRAMTAAPSAWA